MLQTVRPMSAAAVALAAEPAGLRPPRQRRYHQQQPREHSQYLRAHEKTGPDLTKDDRPVPPFRRTVPPDRVSVPRAASAGDLRLIRRDVNYVRANANAAGRGCSRRQLSGVASASAGDLSGHHRLGELPAYLVKRRRAAEAAAQAAGRPDPDQPAGHRKLSDPERRRTLALLAENHRLLLVELNRLPVRTDTLRLVRVKGDIERKLAELEEAVAIFSRPKVFVRIDS